MRITDEANPSWLDGVLLSRPRRPAPRARLEQPDEVEPRTDLGDGHQCGFCGDDLLPANVRRGGRTCPACNWIFEAQMRELCEAEAVTDGLHRLRVEVMFELWDARVTGDRLRRAAERVRQEDEAVAWYMGRFDRRAERDANLDEFRRRAGLLIRLEDFLEPAGN